MTRYKTRQAKVERNVANAIYCLSESVSRSGELSDDTDCHGPGSPGDRRHLQPGGRAAFRDRRSASRDRRPAARVVRRSRAVGVSHPRVRGGPGGDRLVFAELVSLRPSGGSRNGRNLVLRRPRRSGRGVGSALVQHAVREAPASASACCLASCSSEITPAFDSWRSVASSSGGGFRTWRSLTASSSATCTTAARCDQARQASAPVATGSFAASQAVMPPAISPTS